MSSLLDKLQRRLAGQFRARPDVTKEHLLSRVSALGQEETVRDLLRELIAEPRDLHRVARRSYIHPNGYDKVVLVSARETAVPFELRVHIWWPSSASELPDIHNHDWDFASQVLCGELWCEEYLADDVHGEAMNRYLYVRSQKGAFEIRHEGMARLRKAQQYTLQAGHVYAMDRMILHRVRGRSDQTTATLVLQGPTGHLTSEVYRSGTREETSPGPSPIIPIDPGALSERLNKVLPLV